MWRYNWHAVQHSVDDLASQKKQSIWYGLAFNGGRLLSYAIAGMIAATLGSSLIILFGIVTFLGLLGPSLHEGMQHAEQPGSVDSQAHSH